MDSDKPAASLNPHEIGALVALVDQNRLGEAERRARALLEVHPGAGMLWKILSVTLVRQGRDALQALHRTAQLMPQDAEAHANLGAALHDQGQWAQASASLFRALAIRPDDAGTLVDAANALKALGRPREAVPLYRRAIELQPGLAEAHNNLGNALLALDEHAAAAGCYRRALAINPALSTAHNNLGLALAAGGQAEEAAASYRQALLLNPGYVEAMSNLGNVLRDLGGHREAASLHARAVELEPANAESRCNLGNALLELGRIDAASESFRRALALKPEHPLAHVSLATALRLQRRGEEAEAGLAGSGSGRRSGLRRGRCSLLGELRADRGLFAEAEELFRRALAVDPHFPFAYWSIAAHRKMTQDDAAWLHGAQALLTKRLPLRHEISLRYALGKYFDDLGRYAEAFGHFQRANELNKRQGSNYDAATLSRRVDGIIRHADAAFLRPRPRASASELPVFIVGMPRSGTSLAEQILASHPQVVGAGELTFWDSAFAAVEKLQGGAADAALISDAAERCLNLLTGFSGAARRVVDKNPSNFLYAGLIHAAFPQARIIHMQRHPIDTCLSIYFQNFFNIGPYANDFDNLAHYYRQYVRITDHWRAVLPASTLLEIPYEALIDDQEGWTRRMLEFIGLPWDAKCLDFHRTERVVVTASKWQVRQKIHAASVGRWRNYQNFLGPLLHLAQVPPSVP